MVERLWEWWECLWRLISGIWFWKYTNEIYLEFLIFFFDIVKNNLLRGVSRCGRVLGYIYPWDVFLKRYISKFFKFQSKTYPRGILWHFLWHLKEKFVSSEAYSILFPLSLVSHTKVFDRTHFITVKHSAWFCYLSSCHIVRRSSLILLGSRIFLEVNLSVVTYACLSLKTSIDS